MSRFAWLRRPAALLTLATAFAVSPMAVPTVHAAGPSGIATFSARYVAATAETDPAFGEAAGALVCGSGVGGDCFDLTSFMGQGLFEVTQVIPDSPLDTSTITVFQGYDINQNDCVSCLPGEPDVSWESDGNGVIGGAIPLAPGIPLQVFVRAASLDDTGTLRDSLTGTIVVTVMDQTQLDQFCSTQDCGQPFQQPQACLPTAGQTGGCTDLPYPYPG